MSMSECENSCQNGGSSRAMCLLPRWRNFIRNDSSNTYHRAPGPCQDRIPKWYFDNFEKRCMPFYYGGCEGEKKIFVSRAPSPNDDGRKWEQVWQRGRMPEGVPEGVPPSGHLPAAQGDWALLRSGREILLRLPDGNLPEVRVWRMWRYYSVASYCVLYHSQLRLETESCQETRTTSWHWRTAEEDAPWITVYQLTR